jgi:hypothetical protein
VGFGFYGRAGAAPPTGARGEMRARRHARGSVRWVPRLGGAVAAADVGGDWEQAVGSVRDSECLHIV